MGCLNSTPLNGTLVPGRSRPQHHHRTHAPQQHQPGPSPCQFRVLVSPHEGINPQFPNGIVSSVSFVSTTNTARSLAGFVLLALALTAWRSPGSSEKLCPAL